jgi:plasmid stability protein
LIASIWKGIEMAALSIRNLDDDVKERLRRRAASHGRSMESEVRAILVDAVSDPRRSKGLFPTIIERFGEIGGAELDLPPRGSPVRSADLLP